MPYIKNIPHEEVVSLAESVQTVPGQVVIMPAKKPHSVHAEEDFKMVLTVVFPQ